MFGCRQFEIEIEDDIDILFGSIRRIAERDHIKLRGSEEEGSFDTGVVEGTYRVVDDIIIVTVIDKPYKEECRTVERILRQFFSGDDSKDYRKIFGYMNLKRL